MIELTVLAVILAGTGAAWLYARDAAFPPFVLGATWVVTVFAYLVSSDPAYPLTETTGAVVVLGFLSFLAGAMLSARAAPTDAPKVEVDHRARAPGGWLVWCSVLGLPLFALQARAIAATGPTDSFFINLRLALTDEGAGNPYGVLAYLVTIAVFGAIVHVLGLVKTTPLKTIAIVSAAVAYSLLSTGRSYFLWLIVAIGGGLVVSGRIRIRTALLTGALVFLGVFATIAVFLGKGVSGEGESLSELGTALVQYLLAGLAGLNDWLKEAHPLELGANSLRTVNAALARLGFYVRPKELIQEFRFVPFSTNVYTVHREYFEDFGWAGIVVSQVLFGAMHGGVYLRARRGSRVHVFFYGLLLFPLAMQGFHDQYMTLLSSWVQALFLVVVVRILEARAAHTAASLAASS